MIDVEDRKALHCWVSETSREALFRFSGDNGVTITSAIEVWLRDLTAAMDKAGSAEVWPDLVLRARRLDAQRRRRH